ncbi:DNA alkylation repair protein [Desulfovibrio mangrovi]|uniref:DNA alkylation repair protein n=1 Tax=Desulfovibrio mangrovi TaxID=2976983 RepID=UPI00224540E8|nr:DNA alkylation repair protein [Desulfovibrio mangrovi]UZP66413.1 DNA alkylation repair protein [Desulfovibrio mangrovi]
MNDTPLADMTLISSLRRNLRDLAVPEDAAPMQAYMKSAMPFLGCKKPVRAQACKALFAARLPLSPAVLLDTVAVLWHEATHREERYCALSLLHHKKHAKHLHTPDARLLTLLEEMVVTGAWWDFVDELTHSFGSLLRHAGESMRPLLLDWAACDNMWKRRIAILCQLRFKELTDFAFMQACIEPSLPPSPMADEFFLRKGIGWALRDYAWSNPAAVAAYVQANEKRLSPLTRREALKRISK